MIGKLALNLTFFLYCKNQQINLTKVLHILIYIFSFCNKSDFLCLISNSNVTTLNETRNGFECIS